MIKHSERCKKCKVRIYELLCSSFGEVMKNYNLHLPARLEDYSNLSYFQSLSKIYKFLQECRGYYNFVRAKHLSRADFFVVNPGFIVEFDESQHFTAQRKIALELYSSSLMLGFDRNKWITLCEKMNKHDNDRNCIYRDEQRAWYDTLKDMAPDILGLRPTTRLYAKNLAWCKLDPSSKKDQDLFKEVLYGPYRF